MSVVCVAAAPLLLLTCEGRFGNTHQVYAERRMAVVGHRPNPDPLRNGEAKVDFDSHSMAVVVGQYKIKRVLACGDLSGRALNDVIVEYGVDFDQHHSRAYHAVVVPITHAITFKCTDAEGTRVRMR